jgi:predicted DNA-binding transcriptional regulator AlpA
MPVRRYLIGFNCYLIYAFIAEFTHPPQISLSQHAFRFSLSQIIDAVNFAISHTSATDLQAIYCQAYRRKNMQMTNTDQHMRMRVFRCEKEMNEVEL